MSGLLQKGNINLNALPKVQNKDGSYSTVKTITIGTDKGTVLLPTIIDGKEVSIKQAIDYYKETGKHLGIFKTEQDAEIYDQSMHQKMGWVQGNNDMARNYLTPQQNWQNMQSQTGMLTNQASSKKPILSSDPKDLYATAQQQEAGFVNTAPSGYFEDKLIDVNPNNIDKYWVEGYRMAREDKRSDAYLGIQQELLGFKRTDREKKRMIDDGMIGAVNEGGYEGVIEYLKRVDPDRAIEFHKEKLSLDEAMMKNELYKELMPLEKEKALAEGYAVLGKMGYSLLKARPEDRDNMYKLMLPMVQKLNPNAPKTLNNEAVGMFLLAAAQSTDANELFKLNKAENNLKGEVGKAIIGKNYLLSQGYSADSPEVKAYDNVLNYGSSKSEYIEFLKAQLEFNKQKAENQKVAAFNKNLQSELDDFLEAKQARENFLALYNNPARGTQAYGAAVTQTLRASGEKGTISDYDKRPLVEGSGPIAQWYKSALGLAGKNPGGTEFEWNQLDAIQKSYFENASSKFKAKINAWSEAARKQGIPETVIQDTVKQMNIKAFGQPGEDQINDLMKKYPNAPFPAIRKVVENPELMDFFIQKYGKK